MRAAEGGSFGSDSLVPDEAREGITEAVDLRVECLLSGANYYSMMFEGYVPQAVGAIDDFLRQIG